MIVLAVKQLILYLIEERSVLIPTLEHFQLFNLND